MVTSNTNSILTRAIPDTKTLISNLKKSRNYYSHYSKKLEKKALKVDELYYLSEKLKLLLVLAFLIEIGISEPVLEELLDSNGYKFFNHILTAKPTA